MPSRKKQKTNHSGGGSTNNHEEISTDSASKQRKRDLSPESQQLLNLVPEANRRTMTSPADELDGPSSPGSSSTPVQPTDNKSDSKSKKPTNIDVDDDDENPPGEWEVERIVDIATDENDRVLFRCRWAGFNADEDTWETRHHFANAKPLFNGFCTAQRKLLHDNLASGLLEPAIRAILHCLIKKRPDPCILLRIAGHHVNEHTTSVKFPLAPALSKLKRIYSPDPPCISLILPDRSLRSIDAKDFRSDLDGLIELSGHLAIPPWDLYDVALLYMSRRKNRTYPRIREFSRSLVEKIESLKKRPVDIQVENLLDSSVPPDFEYLNEYDLNTNLEAKPGEEFLRCVCKDDCDKSCACIHENEKLPPFRALKDKPITKASPQMPIYSCTRYCPCRCSFKEVSGVPMLPFTIFRTKNRGWGLRTRAPIKKGQLVTTYLGQLLNVKQRIERQTQQIKELGGWNSTYLFDLDFNSDNALYAVDARLKGNEARFINHSCNPNLTINPIYSDFRNAECPVLGFFAKEDIRDGSELTIDYNAITRDDYVIPPYMLQLREKLDRKRGRRRPTGADDHVSPEDDGSSQSPPSRPGPSSGADSGRPDTETPPADASREAEDIENAMQLNPCYCRSSICRGFIF